MKSGDLYEELTDTNVIDLICLLKKIPHKLHI